MSAGLYRCGSALRFRPAFVPNAGPELDLQGFELRLRPSIGKARIHANRHRAPILRLRVLRPQSSEQSRTCPRPYPAPAGAAGRKGCPRSRRKPQPEPSSRGARHGRSTGCRAGGHPPATAHRPHRPSEYPPTRGTPPVSGEGHSTESPASAHPGYPLSSADLRSANLLAATAGHRVHRRGQGLPMTSLPQPAPGRGAAGPRCPRQSSKRHVRIRFPVL